MSQTVHRVRRRGGVALVAFVTASGLVGTLPRAEAKKLVDVIPGLFGADGITLADGLHNAHFSQEALEELESLSDGISSGANQTSVGASTSSFTFDVQQAVFVRSTESLGPTLAQRADTIGKGKINVAFSYTRLNYKRFEGDGLDDINLELPHDDTCASSTIYPPGFQPPPGAPGSPPGSNLPCIFPATGAPGVPSPLNPSFEADTIGINLDIDLSQDQFLFYGKYGITDRWEAGLILPVIDSEIRVTGNAFINRNSATSAGFHNFCIGGKNPVNLRDCAPTADQSTINDPDRTVDRDSESDFGIGDLLLLTKYNFLHDQAMWPDLAVLGGVRFDTGDEDNFRGAGNTGFQGLLIASKQFGIFEPHLNWGVELTTDGGDTNLWRLVAGTEVTPAPYLTLSFDFLGLNSFNGEGVNDNIWDFGIGAKVNPWSTLTFLGNILLPINQDDGLRTNVTWTFGLEYTF